MSEERIGQMATKILVRKMEETLKVQEFPRAPAPGRKYLSKPPLLQLGPVRMDPTESEGPIGADWAQDESESPTRPEERPAPAPTVVPVKGLSPGAMPKFAPLNIGRYGQGGAIVGFPTPLPQCPRNAGGEFVHPVNDPRLAGFFSALKDQDQGWQPPMPPVPPGLADKIPTAQVLPMANAPAQSKAPPSKKQRGWKRGRRPIPHGEYGYRAKAVSGDGRRI